MKMRFILMVAMVIGVTIVHAEPFPTTFTVDSLDAATKNLKAWNGNMIALAGLVDSIGASHWDKPYFHVLLRKPNPEKKGIWIGWITKLDSHKLKVGDIVLVLGYLTEIDVNDRLWRKSQTQPFFLIGLCMANVTTKDGIFSAEVRGQWEEWMNGSIPVNEPSPADTSAHNSGPGLRLRLDK